MGGDIRVFNPETNKFEDWSTVRFLEYYKYVQVNSKRESVSPLLIDSGWYMSEGPGKTADPSMFGAGLFNAVYRPRYERVTAGSSAPLQSAWAMLATPFALAMLRACERRRAMTPGLTRMRLASSARVTSRTQWFSFSTAQ